MNLRFLVLLLGLAQASSWKLEVRGGASPRTLLPAKTAVARLMIQVLSGGIKRLSLNDNKTSVYLCGSAHALSQSEEVARRMVQELKPDLVILGSTEGGRCSSHHR